MTTVLDTMKALAAEVGLTWEEAAPMRITEFANRIARARRCSACGLVVACQGCVICKPLEELVQKETTP